MARVVVKCPNPQCPAQYRVEEALLGKRGKCKQCGTSFLLTTTDAELAAVSTPVPPAGQGADDSKGRPCGDDGVPLTWAPGDVILDLYEVKKELGRGGMGQVHLVRHRNWQTNLAVKSVLPDRVRSQHALDNFQREAEVWVDRLGLHPHIVSCS
jgi:predicted Zn finger-like uncharacterized protein